VIIDNTAPDLELPEPIVAEATNANGAAITFNVWVTDNLDPQASLTVAPESGSVFQIGTTVVQVSSSDWLGNTQTENFTVTVRDTTAPVVAARFHLSCWQPGQQELPALPNYMAQAAVTDAVGVSGVFQSPAAGNARPAGITAVTISATDAAGNIGTNVFNVLVNDATLRIFRPLSQGFFRSRCSRMKMGRHLCLTIQCRP
jgi:hypothetical protein